METKKSVEFSTISNRDAVFFDLETTGLDIPNDRIVQIAIVKLKSNGEREEKNVLINPTIPIPKEASDVHGITDEMVKNKPTFKQVARSFSEYIKGCDLLGYNIVSFDLPLLVEEMLRADVDFSIEGVYVVDVMSIYKKLQPRDLSSCYKYYTGKVLEGSHDALNDTRATVDAFIGMLNSEDELNGKDIDALQEFSGYNTNRVDFAGKFVRNEEGVICFSFGKSKGLPVTKDLGFVDWMLSKDFSQDTKNWCMKIKNGQVK
jgi:DNA polymerase-3 subunit epsilon